MADSRRREKKKALTQTQASQKGGARIDGTRQDAGAEVLRCAQDDGRHPVPLLRGAGKEVAGDDSALNFAGAFVDGDDAGVTVHAFDVGLAGIAETAVDLHGFVDNAINHFAGV